MSSPAGLSGAKGVVGVPVPGFVLVVHDEQVLNVGLGYGVLGSCRSPLPDRCSGFFLVTVGAVSLTAVFLGMVLWSAAAACLLHRMAAGIQCRRRCCRRLLVLLAIFLVRCPSNRLRWSGSSLGSLMLGCLASSILSVWGSLGGWWSSAVIKTAGSLAQLDNLLSRLHIGFQHQVPLKK